MKVSALDLGFGYTNGKRGEREISFPSVAGPERRILESSLTEKDPLTHMIDKNRGVFVGDLALRQSSTKTFSLKEQKAEQPGIDSMIEAALGALSPGPETDHINLVTGLPVTFYFKQKRQIADLLEKDHNIFMQYGDYTVTKKVRIHDVKVIPQPLGSAMDFLLHENGSIKEDQKRHAAGKIGVLDIGFFTNDLLMLHKMEIVQDQSRSLRSGMSVALKALADAGVDLPIYELDKQIRNGQYPLAKEKAFAALADQILGEIETYWGAVDLILVTGGGGVALFPYLEKHLKNVQLLGQMSNVRGYHKIGMRSWR